MPPNGAKTNILDNLAYDLFSLKVYSTIIKCCLCFYTLVKYTRISVNEDSHKLIQVRFEHYSLDP